MKVTALAKGDIEPVPLAELKEFCRLSSGDIEDTSLRRMLRAARIQAENYARISISPRKWRSSFELPYYSSTGISRNLVDEDDVIDFVKLRGPLISVEKVTLLSRMNQEITAPPYGVFPSDNRLVWDRPQGTNLGLDFSGVPADVMFDDNAFLLQVDYTAGYPDVTGTGPNAEKLCEAPDDIITAICLIVSDIYEHRGETNGGEIRKTIPARARDILKSYWTSAL